LPIEKNPLPFGERIKVRGDKYFAECRLPIEKNSSTLRGEDKGEGG